MLFTMLITRILFCLVTFVTGAPVNVDPRKPPPTQGPGGYVSVPSYSSASCGLVTPTAQTWRQNLPNIQVFAAAHWTGYLNDPGYNSFPHYLRDKLAPNVAPSASYCDTVGGCSFSCQALDPSLSQHDRQMAYFLFEQIGGVDHLLKSLREGLQEGALYADGQVPSLVARYSAASRISTQIQQEKNDHRRMEKLGMTAVSALLMMAGGALAIPGFIGLDKTAAPSMVNMAASTYISVVGTINTARADPEKLPDNIEDVIRSSLNDFRHHSMISIAHESKQLMEGDKNNHGQDLLGLMQGQDFFRRDGNIQEDIMRMSEKVFKHAVINALWQWERPYIVDADVPTGACEVDTRGPTENRICLPERPDHSYWIYALDISQENDPGKNHKALIHGPTGYRNFFEGQNSDVYGATLEDVVRSSLAVHEHNLYDALQTADFQTVQSALGQAMNWGNGQFNLMGAYTLAIARNPRGEAISSVWSTHGRNFPCMVGEFGWNDNTYNPYQDQTFNFLVRSGLMFSEDWENLCHNEGHCKGDNDVDWHSRLDALRKPGDPPIPGSLKHPFKKCKQKTKHDYGDPSADFNPPLHERDLGVRFANATMSWA
ncbi:hypothetical protein J4E83_009822 [Alternaria metachromatica]|uniref:uncharacterized protein n=1 Tax=Alternaria metachromatica TaxID=283354 RepID=UPI0020C2ED16|nr:uncharacterized protein J4E83_009822 [Alternaria metachromatica]KAI4606911.1 hypothetical protein J4E83_009822 [Alternaria metachromatica]